MIEYTDNKDSTPFALPSAMTIETIEALAAECKQWPLADKSQLTLDASAVEAITTPGIQLILSLEKTLAARGGAFRITGAKEHFLRAFKDAGLDSVVSKAS